MIWTFQSLITTKSLWTSWKYPKNKLQNLDIFSKDYNNLLLFTCDCVFYELGGAMKMSAKNIWFSCEKREYSCFFFFLFFKSENKTESLQIKNAIVMDYY